VLNPVQVVAEQMWFDGELRDAESIAVAPFTHALHYGSGVFEGIRAYRTAHGPAVFRLREHLERFHRSAEVYGLNIAYDVDELSRAIFQTLDANGFHDGYIRPLAYYGAKGISLAPKFNCPTHVLVALKPLSGSLLGDGGIRTTISRWQKTPSKSLPSHVKACGHYTNSILALQDATAAGFDEAILLNDRGQVAEGTGENIFVVKDGAIATNDPSADVLPGITRDTVIALAADAGIPVTVRDLTTRDLFDADEVFFTGTAAEVAPIACIDDLVFTEHPVTHYLAAQYAKAVTGKNLAHRDWVTYRSDVR
jgi:branched-chain amino acid aminotransferase